PGVPNQPDPQPPSQATEPNDHTRRQSEVDAAKSHQGPEESMVGAQPSHSSDDFKDPKGHMHHQEYYDDGKGDWAIFDKDTKTGKGFQFISHKDGSWTRQTTDPHTGHTTTQSSTGEFTVTNTETGKVLEHTPP